MSTVSNRIKTDENSKLIDVINYLGDLLRDLDIKIYSEFVEENFNNNSPRALSDIYLNLLDKLKYLQF